jgi:NTE family protein
LVEAGVGQDVEVVGISGTSGGAASAALAWYALRKGERPIWKRVIDFWKDNIAHGWNEETFNQFIIDAMRLVNKGAFPILQLSPSSPLMQTMMSFMTSAPAGASPTFRSCCADISTSTRSPAGAPARSGQC